MTELQSLVDSIVHVGIGPVSARQDPTVYDALLVAFCLSFILALTYCVRNRTLPAVGGQVLVLLIDIVPIYLLWLGLGTPFDRLPFGPPTIHDQVFSIPAHPIYIAVALLAHAAISLSALYVLIVIWADLQLDLNPSSDVDSFLLTVALVLSVLAWDLHAWPEWVVIPGEFYAVYLVSGYLTFGAYLGLYRLLKIDQAEAPLPQRRLERLQELLWHLLAIVGGVVVLALHRPDTPYVPLLGIYVALVLLDSVIAALVSVFRKQAGDYHFLSARRWLLTIPLTLVIGAAGADGAFSGAGYISNIPAALWSEAGAAAAAYMLLKPLIDLARVSAGVRESTDQPDLGETVARIGKTLERIIPLASGQSQPTPAPPHDSSGADAIADTSSSAVSANTKGGPGQSGRFAVLPPQQPATSDVSHLLSEMDDDLRTARRKEYQLFERLNFPTGAIFFIALIAYHFLANSGQIGTTLNSSAVPLVFGFVTLVAGVLNFLSNRILQSTRNTFLLMMFVNIVVAALAEVFALTPTEQIPTVLLPVAAALPALLVFLTLGQLAYLYRLVDTAVSIEQQEVRGDDVIGWLDFANAQYGAGRYDSARAAYEKAIAANPTDTWAEIGLGAALIALGRLDDALSAYDQARLVDSKFQPAWMGVGYVRTAKGEYEASEIAYRQSVQLNPKDAEAWNNLGDALNHLERYQEALVVADHALAIASKDANTLDTRASALSGLGRYDEACAAFEEALGLDQADADIWTNYGTTLVQMGRSEDAQSAFSAALALNPSLEAARTGQTAVAALGTAAKSRDD